jgi:hypothetical protein
MLKALLFLFVAMVVLYSCSTEQPRAQNFENEMKQPNVVSGEYIVTLDDDVQMEDLVNQFSAYNMVIIKDLGRRRYLIHLDQDPGLDTLMEYDCFKNAECKIQHNFKYKASGGSGYTTY